MIKETIMRISSEFINEAYNSPNLFSDMAMMEKYLAESYSERIFVELLQNADDATAKKMKLIEKNNNIYVANNGRAFTDIDIISICRSGASNKKRRNSIGYRGVGFKSTSNLSEDILIYSNEVCFTFSKNKSAQILKKDNLENIPKIRVPFLLEQDEIENEIYDTISSLIHEGNNTVFVFKKAKMTTIINELKDISEGYFIFLKNISNVEINLENLNKNYKINRKNNKITIFGASTVSWLLLGNRDNYEDVELAFKIDENSELIECEDNEGLFHCYLPTSEKTGFSFKINGDFSTDPSRKHLSLDERTVDVINRCASLLFSKVKEIVNNRSEENSSIIKLLDKQINIYKFSRLLSDEFNKLLQSSKWIELNGGNTIGIKEYKKIPSWLQYDEYKLIQNSKGINQLIPKGVLNSVFSYNIHQFLSKYSEDEYSIYEYINLLKDFEVVKLMSEYLIGKVLGCIISKCYETDTVVTECLESVLIKNNNKYYIFSEIVKDNIYLSPENINGVKDVALAFHIKWFCNKTELNYQQFNKYSDSLEKVYTTREYKFNPIQNIERDTKFINKSMLKWRAAEQSCVEIEKMMNNIANDVSKQNLGYDVKSITSGGEERYIEVKLLSKDKGFTLTNNEYSSAHLLGERYYICLIEEKNEELIVTYIRNPIKNLKMEKRIKQWEWFCEEYIGDKLVIKLI